MSGSAPKTGTDEIRLFLFFCPRTSAHAPQCVQVQKYDAIIKIAHNYRACEAKGGHHKKRVHNTQKEMLCVLFYYNVYRKTNICILDVMQYRQKIC
jgi:hypothetical protein